MNNEQVDSLHEVFFCDFCILDRHASYILRIVHCIPQDVGIYYETSERNACEEHFQVLQQSKKLNFTIIKEFPKKKEETSLKHFIHLLTAHRHLNFVPASPPPPDL